MKATVAGTNKNVEVSGAAPPASYEAAWARALIEELVATKSIALEEQDGDFELERDLASELRDADEATLGRVSELLESSSDVFDLFIDDEELDQVMRRTRPPLSGS